LRHLLRREPMISYSVANLYFITMAFYKATAKAPRREVA
jgi:hypothetical protein